MKTAVQLLLLVLLSLTVCREIQIHLSLAGSSLLSICMYICIYLNTKYIYIFVYVYISEYVDVDAATAEGDCPPGMTKVNRHCQSISGNFRY